ncbi:MAG TPA: NADPH-dependent F420 reductase [Acidimicrobiales bacterium]|jgi:NADPH-dependent F420 reductase|nr:NADPH-dependent F420 reductase [Acidimicrobiales bacterium]
MRVGIVGGTGPAGRALAARLASVGLDVVIGSRSAERAQEITDEIAKKWPDRDLPLSPAVNADATAADLVVVATPWDAAADTAGSLRARLAGKVVISMGNALAKIDGELQAVVPPLGSVAAGVQAAAPESMVAAAFHHLPARSLGDLDRDASGDILVCSDHAAALDATAALIRRVPGLRPFSAGSLAAAGPVEAFTAVLLGLNARYKGRATIHLTGIDDTPR